ncbi:hypothetical protein BHE74_00036957 [Ensete ventricosum]|nr:hypothetical protein BHE74_00036957 [Ensete ventricosum]
MLVIDQLIPPGSIEIVCSVKKKCDLIPGVFATQLHKKSKFLTAANGKATEENQGERKGDGDGVGGGPTHAHCQISDQRPSATTTTTKTKTKTKKKKKKKKKKQKKKKGDEMENKNKKEGGPSATTKEQKGDKAENKDKKVGGDFEEGERRWYLKEESIVAVVAGTTVSNGNDGTKRRRLFCYPWECPR